MTTPFGNPDTAHARATLSRILADHPALVALVAAGAFHAARLVAWWRADHDRRGNVAAIALLLVIALTLRAMAALGWG